LTRKDATDFNYLLCADQLMRHGAAGLIAPQLATHNALTLAQIHQLAAHHQTPYELQRLYGMGNAVYEAFYVGLAEHDFRPPTRIYAPVGSYEDLLPYLVRRLLENGASTAFVNQIHDPKIETAQLIQHAPATLAKENSMPLPLPQSLFSDRRNSLGLDLRNEATLGRILGHLRSYSLPAEPDHTTLQTLRLEVERAQEFWPTWAATAVDERAHLVEKIADLIEENRDSLRALLVFEAKKTIYDAEAEIREAVDFCRYYAHQALRVFADHGLPSPTGESNHLRVRGRGVFACISPWNFPLAIFMGQIAAALVTGNAVVAKPAEQTPRIADFAQRLCYKAGIPREVLQVVFGAGETGAALVAHPAIAGVAFTGSTEVARLINRALAAKDGPIVPLIAETGGINAMIVDSTALLDQVVDDVILSAFGSAGQRCSALRVLYVQDDVAGRLIPLLRGAVETLRVGAPDDPATDIPPVIDREAYRRLQQHLDDMIEDGYPILAKALVTSPKAKTHTVPLTIPDHLTKSIFDAPPTATALGPKLCYDFVAPHIVEVPNLKAVDGEHFGPILHVIRYAARDLDDVINEINASGYGLTFGLQTRIDTKAQDIAQRIHAGNVYVNRSMIGAVVGVQPFGGSGLSGTGPKAGGPHYLWRFVNEQTITINTTAGGGNIDLMRRQ
jgi:RHH-type proline utilization regulon transcriptional repressor/proline dehydrogenase/delta 1-pyrroline-5-carboxylate dehydrogenase